MRVRKLIDGYSQAAAGSLMGFTQQTMSKTIRANHMSLEFAVRLTRLGHSPNVAKFAYLQQSADEFDAALKKLK